MRIYRYFVSMRKSFPPNSNNKRYVFPRVKFGHIWERTRSSIPIVFMCVVSVLFVRLDTLVLTGCFCPGSISYSSIFGANGLQVLRRVKIPGYIRIFGSLCASS